MLYKFTIFINEMDLKKDKISTEQLEGAVLLEKRLMELRHELKPN